MTLRSRLEPKPGAGHLSDCTTKVLDLPIFLTMFLPISIIIISHEINLLVCFLIIHFFLTAIIINFMQLGTLSVHSLLNH